MTTHNRYPPREEGFTLVEVAIALSILVVVTVPLATGLHATGAIRADTESSLRMAMIAADRLELLKLDELTLAEYATAYPASGTAFTPSADETTGLLVSYVTGSIRVSSPDPAVTNALLVEVEIFYLDEAQNQQRAFVSTVFREDFSP